MELALSLGDTSKPFKFLDKTPKPPVTSKDLGFCMGLGATSASSQEHVISEGARSGEELRRRISSSDPLPLQLDLLPFSPAPPRHPPSQILRFPWLNDNLLTEPGSGDVTGRGFDVNRLSGEDGEDGAALSSPNSAASSFQMDFGIRSGSGGTRGSKRDLEVVEAERASSRASDDEENGLTRKKLRLSKEQSAFLEESFKEHNTLNPKQKLALAKQLNLRPRQVEVWFQNRRARTKLKQTEVDCEYLKRCCETLTEENKRLQKELQELRALKTSQPFYMQLPATTLTMCPSCERVATTNPNTNACSSACVTTTSPSATISTNPTKSSNMLFPFSHVAQPQAHQPAS